MMLNKRLLFTLLLVGSLSLGTLTACGSPNPTEPETPPVGSESSLPDTFIPAENGVSGLASFDMPYMGMQLLQSPELQEAVNEHQLYLDGHEETSEDGSAIRWAFASWSLLTEEQKTQKIDFNQDAFTAWLDGLDRVGALGMYDAQSVEELDTITGCTEHQLLGKSEDGAYAYYLSLDTAAPEDIQILLQGASMETRPREAFVPGVSAFDPVQPDPGSIGTFSTTDIYGTAYTESMFADHELTLVNIFATWCSPCVKEIPELQELSETMESKGVGVVGIVLDTLGPDGQPDEKAVETAKKLAERTGAKYPMLIPDAAGLNGRLYGVTAVPETFFVDKNGNVVGKSYPGARDLDGWTKIVDQTLEAMQK